MGKVNIPNIISDMESLIHFAKDKMIKHQHLTEHMLDYGYIANNLERFKNDLKNLEGVKNEQV